MTDLQPESVVRKAQRCGARRYFERVPGCNPAHAVCGRPAGHAHAHEHCRGSTLYTWIDKPSGRTPVDEPVRETLPNTIGPDDPVFQRGQQ